MKANKESIYLDEDHEGWIINLIEGGLEIVSPGRGELQIVLDSQNSASMIEQQNPQGGEGSK